MRIWVCAQVIKFITPYTESWGVKIINFQLESTKIKDENYAREYEAASLSMAKAKANLRAVSTQNEIRLQTARAAAEASRIEAEGKSAALVTEAQGNAEARKIEAKARNEAAHVMRDGFARQFALAGQRVEFAKALNAQVLSISSGASGGDSVNVSSLASSVVNSVRNK